MTSGEDTIHFATEIHKSAERLQYLINDIIKLSELDSDDTKIEFETLDLHEMALNCQAMMEIPAEKNEVTVEVQGEATSVRGNRNLIDELIYNLCSNAVRYQQKRRKSHDYYTHGGRTSDSDRQRHWYRYSEGGTGTCL